MATKFEKFVKGSNKSSLTAERNGTNITRNRRFDLLPARISWAKITSSTLTVEMEEGRTLLLPTAALEPVCSLPFRERRAFHVTDGGKALEWPKLTYKVTLRQLLGVED